MAGRNREAMSSTCWVGRVKSTVPPSLLRDAFAEFGNILRIETGFAGFAFVEFEEMASCLEGVKMMNKKDVPNVGEIHVQQATYRGYEDACRKRDEYRRKMGFEITGYGTIGGGEGVDRTQATRPQKKGRSRSRSSPSRSRRRRRRRRRRGSPSGSRSRSRSATPKRPKGRGSPSPLNKAKADKSRSASRSSASEIPVAAIKKTPNAAPEMKEDRRVELKPAKTEEGNADQQADDYAGEEYAWEDDVQMPELSKPDRGDVLTFFDGAGAYDLLVEAASVLRAALPDCLNGFPHAYPGLNQEDAGALLNVVAGFASPGVEEGSKARVVEIRQSFSVDASGQRTLRKVVAVDGVDCFTEKMKLPDPATVAY